MGRKEGTQGDLHSAGEGGGNNRGFAGRKYGREFKRENEVPGRFVEEGRTKTKTNLQGGKWKHQGDL